MNSLWIAGFPSFLGGADTELLHMIDLWRMYDIDVNLVPMFGCDLKMKKYVIDLGCQVYDYSPTIFKDKIVAIPLENNLFDFYEKFEWAISHEKECNQIAKNALEFAKKNLRKQNAIEKYKDILIMAGSK